VAILTANNAIRINVMRLDGLRCIKDSLFGNIQLSYSMCDYKL